MKRKAIIISSIVASSLAIGVSFFAIESNHRFKPLQANEVHPGTIVIDVDDPNIDLDLGYIRVNSEAGNPFNFNFHGLTIEDGYFKLPESGYYFNNTTIINGITELRFFTPDYSQNIKVGRRLNYETTMDWEEYKLDSNQASVTFDDYNPGYFYIETLDHEAFSFSKLVINYECVADVPSFTITKLENYAKIGGYNVSTYDALFIHEGDNLSSISLESYYFTVSSGKGFSVNDSLVSNLSITYKESESTVALSGSYIATLSFTYGGATYTMNEVYIIGYDHVGYSIEDIYFTNSEMLRQESDSIIPEEFKINSYGDLIFYDTNDDEIDNYNSYESDIQVTEEMIVTSDADRFTGMGRHDIKITYQGVTRELTYSIYDPTINNIRSLRFNGDLSVDVGASVADFLAVVATGEFYIDYYDTDLAKDLPNSVTLTAENFVLTEGMFDNNGYVEVSVNYSTYVGAVTVRVKLAKGNLVKTYTNEDGVSMFGDLIHAIAIYDNGTCEIDPGPNSEVFAYRIEDDKLIITYFESVELTFLIDDENNTFDKYSSSGNLLYTLLTNFHNAFPDAPDEYVYPANVYDDYTITISMGPGGDLTFPFTIDPDVPGKIYFTFMGTPCYGMIDFDNLQLTVYLVE